MQTSGSGSEQATAMNCNGCWFPFRSGAEAQDGSGGAGVIGCRGGNSRSSNTCVLGMQEGKDGEAAGHGRAHPWQTAASVRH